MESAAWKTLVEPVTDLDRKTFLVTGAMGCIGAWTVSHLLRKGHCVVAFDLSYNTRRLKLLLESEELDRVVLEQGDLTDFGQVAALFEQHSIDHIIHLAALQVPFCRADPVLGSRVNVAGTVNLFEAVRQAGLPHMAYASSVAVYGRPEPDNSNPLVEADAQSPMTLYGVYKQANEGTARLYWADHAVSSVGLRPHTVYGPGRDQGITSDPTQAMLAAVLGEPFTIQYSNSFLLQFASDVAQQFIEASQDQERGNFVFNLGGEARSMSQLIEMIQAIVPEAQIDFVDNKLPIPELMDNSALRQHFRRVYQTPLESGIEQTISMFQKLVKKGYLPADKESR